LADADFLVFANNLDLYPSTFLAIRKILHLAIRLRLDATVVSTYTDKQILGARAMHSPEKKGKKRGQRHSSISPSDSSIVQIDGVASTQERSDQGSE